MFNSEAKDFSACFLAFEFLTHVHENKFIKRDTFNYYNISNKIQQMCFFFLQSSLALALLIGGESALFPITAEK